MTTKKKTPAKTKKVNEAKFTLAEIKKALLQLDYDNYKNVDYGSAEFRLRFGNEIELHDINVDFHVPSLIEDVIYELKLLK